MNVDDRDELLQVTDDEVSSSDDEDNRSSNEIQDGEVHQELNPYPSIKCNYSKNEFLAVKCALIFTSFSLIILLPAYLDSINVRSSAYNLLLMNSTFTALALLGVLVVEKMFFSKYKSLRILDSPLGIFKTLILVIVYSVSCFLMVYALDRKRVMCHLQDPIRGLVLVFSLLYYFIFCKRLMGLQRIFAATTVIVGLFIAVDYGLCDEFKCRGFERTKASDDTGSWPWSTHSKWIGIYILGLALLAAYFNILERYIATVETEVPKSANITPSFLTTISRSITFPPTQNREPARSNVNVHNKVSSVHLAFHIHVITLGFVLTSFWTDTLPTIGKGSSFSEFFNFTIESLSCHMQPHIVGTQNISPCANVFGFSWLFIGCHTLFSIASIRFLMMSQCAVYTVATISSALPLVGVWWSLFQLFPLANGGSAIVWAPSVSGELICSLLGLPIILIGMILFFKSHVKECNCSNAADSNYITMPPHVA